MSFIILLVSYHPGIKKVMDRVAIFRKIVFSQTTQIS